jgi:predicted dinucleotide-binding enzyme
MRAARIGSHWKSKAVFVWVRGRFTSSFSPANGVESYGEAYNGGDSADDGFTHPKADGTPMKIAILGTGVVGRTLAGKLAELRHDVVIGTRDTASTLTPTGSDTRGSLSFADWQQDHAAVRLASFADAAAHGELVVNATAGAASLAALNAVGADALAGKVIVDVSNALDFSHGMPPTLSVANTDSVAEQIQRAYPAARVVKALNTVSSMVMIDPGHIPGKHVVFVAGDEEEAKATVRSLLGEFGWAADTIIDLGGVRFARGPEMYIQLWLSLWGAIGTPDFNIAVHRS